MSWEKLSLCECLKNILTECGFDSIPALKSINAQCIDEIEKHLIDKRNFIESLPQCHRKLYHQQSNFQFLPAHRMILLQLPENSDKLSTDSELFTPDNPAFAPILRELIQSALGNFNQVPQAHRYSKELIDFSMYTYVFDKWTSSI